MDKLRDMFTEEVDVPEEEPIKKEVIQVEIPAPQKKEEKIEELPQNEKKVSTPVFFDDNDFANLDLPKNNVKNVRIEKPKNKVVEKKQEKKTFKPTPIISPIYGVLDKNYHKEDIKTKHSFLNTTYHNNKEVSIDDIRKRAYGTLEDDLEITLFGEPDTKKNDEEIDMFDELLDDSNSSKADDSDLFNLIDSMYEKEGDSNGNS